MWGKNPIDNLDKTNPLLAIKSSITVFKKNRFSWYPAK